ncbi:RibD family protein [Marispirochaeta aestuarii]|uniref:RibD family protein n=1 Tax=Marispirochaeta aestuarii TaxID=1963862 RepID=UPI002ABDFBF1|nr:RibD family protein [Marispirochaeta aestuarii]
MRKCRVLLTFAQSIDGNIAARDGESRYISESGSLSLAQELRRNHDAILVGIGTVLKDNPLLTCRSHPEETPLRIILDSGLRLPEDSRIAATASAVPTMLFTCEENLDSGPAYRLREAGIEIQAVSRLESGLDLGEILSRIVELGMESLMVEGGSGVLSAFVAQQLWDRMLVVTSPMILGAGIGPFDRAGILSLDQARKPRVNEIRIMDNEVVWDLSPEERSRESAL